MRACIVARSAHQSEWGWAFAEGLRRHGHQAEIRRDPVESDLLVLWGVRREADIRAQKMAGGEVCILERGYLGDRFRWTSVSFGGGLNGHGEFRGVSDDPARFDRSFDLQPWSHREGPAVIMGQVPADMSLRGLKPIELWTSAAETLRDAGWDVGFRGHPLANGFGLPGVESIEGGLDQVLAEAGLVVTINSNSGVDAVVAGVPAVSLDDRSMAWAVTGHAPDEVVRPERGAWAARLAWCQWTADEMRSGETWARVGETACA